MIFVHHLEKSRSNRVIWLLEALNVEYEVVNYSRDPETQEAPESLKKIYPLGKSPVISDGDKTIAESGAIIEYLIDCYDVENHFRPVSGQSLLDYRYWMHFAEGSLMPLLVMKLVLDKAKERPMPFFIRPVIRKFVKALQQYFIHPRLIPQLVLINDFLGQHQWFAGEHLSGADFQMFVGLQLAGALDDLSTYSHIQRYMSDVKSLESYQRAKKVF